MFPTQPLKLKEHQARLGCDGKRSPGLVFLPTYSMKGRPKIVYSKCIGNFYSFRVRDLVGYLGIYNKNIYPYAGSYYDQPAKFVEAMELVQNLHIQKQEEKEAQLSRRKR